MFANCLKRRSKLMTAIAFGALLYSASYGHAAQDTANSSKDGASGIGTLSCHSVPDSGLNLIIHSTVDIKCVFEGSDGTVEYYKGETGIGFGIDLDFSHDESFHFVVVSAKFKSGSHHLAGGYAGGKASASIGVGGGGKILVGGDHDNIGLKPAAVSGTGVGIEAGLSYMHLEPDTQP